MLAVKPSLLITDDDRAMRETLREVFERRGFNTMLASDGEEAVEIVSRQIGSRQPLHMALLDMHMPRLSGLEAIREVKRIHQLMPCILFSGALDDEILNEAAQIDVFSVLAKPIRFSEITRLVGDAMRQTYEWYR
jgi:DNA-binding NtrC family response regulator